MSYLHDIVHLVRPDIWPFGLYFIRLVTDLLHVPLFIIYVSRNGPYQRSTRIGPVIGPYIYSTVLWYLVPVFMVTLWHVLGHIFVSLSYLSTRVPLTP